MPTAAGPNSNEQGLVFAFDMGDTKNSYVGEPTVNIRAGAELDGSYSASGRVIDNSGTLTAPDGSTGWSSITSPGAAAEYRIAKFPYNSLTEGSTYTFSLELYNPGPNALEIFVDGNLGQPGTTIPLGYSRYTYTYTVTKTGGGTWAIFFGTENKQANVTYSVPRTILFKNYQVEEKSHVTPYTENQRSVNESLFNLTDKSGITLSSTSYTNDAKLIFDGTDDYLTAPFLSDLVGENPSAITFEVVFKPDVLTDYSGIIGDYVGPSGTGFAIKRRSPTDDRIEFRVYAVNTIPAMDAYFVPGETVHVVCTWDNSGRINMYHNGVVKTQISGVGTTWNHGNAALRIGHIYGGMGNPAYFSGEIPIVKIYNKALTAEEIANNYNILKKRFNI